MASKCDGEWRIHDFNGSSVKHQLELVDKNGSYNCPPSEWFTDYDKLKTIGLNDVEFDKIQPIMNYSNSYEYFLNLVLEENKIYENKHTFILNGSYIFSNIDEENNLLSGIEIEHITILIKLFDDLDTRCIQEDIRIDSHLKQLCFKKKYDNSEKERFKELIKIKNYNNNITIDEVANYTETLLNKLNTMLLFKILKNIPNSDYADANEDDYNNMNVMSELKTKLEDIRNKYREKDYILPEQIEIYSFTKQELNDDFGKNDINMNPWDLENFETIYSSFKNNAIFKECINSKMTKNLNNKTSEKTYNEFMKRIEDSNGNFLDDMDDPDDIETIVNICKSFEELSPTDIMNCLKNIDIDPILKNKICDGTITLQSVDVLFIVLSFFGIHINSDNVNDGNVQKVEHLINRITPYVQKILRKILDMAEYIEVNHCNKISNNTRILKTFYNKLFHTRDPIKYPFSDYKIKFDWFKEFNHPIGKVILLVFVAFIFAQIVKLFTMRGEALQK